MLKVRHFTGCLNDKEILLISMGDPFLDQKWRRRGLGDGKRGDWQKDMARKEGRETAARI